LPALRKQLQNKQNQGVANGIRNRPSQSSADLQRDQIDHLKIDKVSGRVSDAVMSFGGFLGLGPLPPALECPGNGFETAVSETQRRDAPAFSDDAWSDRNWEKETHAHNNVAPYG
jgi:hypothetical protein